MVAASPAITLYCFRLSDGVEAAAAARDTVLACFGDEATVLRYFGGSLTYGSLADTRRYIGIWRRRHVSAFRRLLRDAFGTLELRNAPPPERLTTVAGSATWPPSTERQALEAAMRGRWGGLDTAAVATLDSAMAATATPAAPRVDMAQLAAEFSSRDPFARRLAIDRLTITARTAEGDAMMLLALRDSSEYVNERPPTRLGGGAGGRRARGFTPWSTIRCR
jgi:hypothetical protein